MRKGKYFVCRPCPIKPNGMRCRPGYFYIRFYSTHDYPWYEASVEIKLPENKHEIEEQFDDFIAGAEAHRRAA